VGVQLVFETHSISPDNEAGIATGWLQGCLSEEGRALARELGARRHDEGIAAVFTSDLGRAVETADLAFDGSGIPVFLDGRLRECNYGDLNGTPVVRLEQERPRRIEEPFPSGESYRQVVERVSSFLNDLAREWDGTRVVVIGHSATRWALDHLLAGARLHELVDAPFGWQEGWEYDLPSGWIRR
jgi:alpha-ribazole phosphatase/probable phosphoglycerate mutase